MTVQVQAQVQHSGDPRALLTVIITTSPTPSAPSPELLTDVLASFRDQCPVLLACRYVVVFDHYDHVVDEPRLKKGRVSREQADAYAEYKANVKDLITRATLTLQPLWTSAQVEAESGMQVFDDPSRNTVPVDVTSTQDHQITFVEPRQRLGFGLAVRTALRIATTPYVWVHQHDWTLQAPIPLAPMLQVMEMSKHDAIVPVRYICLPSCRLLGYADSPHVTLYPKLEALTQLLQRDFLTPSGQVVPLTPMFFWHDKPHLADRQHYLDTVFPSRLAIARGAFIEDSIGQRARNQMKQGEWARWACWLLHPPGLERPLIRHICGRTWRGHEAEKLRIQRLKGDAKPPREREREHHQVKVEAFDDDIPTWFDE